MHDGRKISGPDKAGWRAPPNQAPWGARIRLGACGGPSRKRIERGYVPPCPPTTLQRASHASIRGGEKGRGGKGSEVDTTQGKKRVKDGQLV